MIERDKILSWMDPGWIRRKENRIILGNPGVGKTHIAISIGYKACQSGMRTLFCTAIDIVNELNASKALNSYIRKVKCYLKPSLLIIDELGYLPIGEEGSNMLFDLISKRYEKGSILITSNLGFSKWGEIFHSGTIASAALDRLVHHCQVTVIEGDSYRLRERRKYSSEQGWIEKIEESDKERRDERE